MAKLKTVNIKNEKACAEILKVANGRCTARTVYENSLKILAWRAEKHMDDLGVPKRVRAGCVYRWREGVGCNSYGNAATATLVEIERKGNGQWHLVRAERVKTATARGCRNDWFYPSNAAKDACPKIGPNKWERI